MFRKGTRVIIVDEAKAQETHARVHNGEKGTIGEKTSKSNLYPVHIDGDSSPYPWYIPLTCLKRIPKRGK